MSKFIKIPIERDFGIEQGEKGACQRIFGLSENENTFMCCECERKFIMNDTMDEYPINCPYCGLEFNEVFEFEEWV